MRKVLFRRLGFVLGFQGYCGSTTHWWLTATEMWSFWVSSLWSRCLQIRFPVKPAGEGRLPASVSFWWCQMSRLWGCGPPLFTYILPVSLDQVLPPYMSKHCVQISPSYKDTSQAELGPTLLTSSQVGLHFQRLYFQIRAEVLVLRIST